MGGEVSVTSKLGTGTTFNIVLKSKSKIRLDEVNRQMSINGPFIYKPAGENLIKTLF
jgi:hypothetical protein